MEPIASFAPMPPWRARSYNQVSIVVMRQLEKNCPLLRRAADIAGAVVRKPPVNEPAGKWGAPVPMALWGFGGGDWTGRQCH